jgi:hypothetical protein
LTRARTARLLLVLGAAVLTTLALGAARFTWANEGVRIEHPRVQAACALGAASALVAAAWAARPRALQAAAGIAALALAALALQRAAWRVEALETGIRARSLAGSVELAWPEVEAVEPRPGALSLRARDGRRVVIASSGFEADERVRLERTIARRVREAAR